MEPLYGNEIFLIIYKKNLETMLRRKKASVNSVLFK